MIPPTLTYTPTTFWEAFLLSPVLGPALALLIVIPIVGIQLLNSRRGSSGIPRLETLRRSALRRMRGYRTRKAAGIPDELPGADGSRPDVHNVDHVVQDLASLTEQLLTAVYLAEQLRNDLENLHNTRSEQGDARRNAP